MLRALVLITGFLNFFAEVAVIALALHIQENVHAGERYKGGTEALQPAFEEALAGKKSGVWLDAPGNATEIRNFATLPVLRGDPAVSLTRATHMASIDLIVVGSGRNSLIRRAFLGSVTRRLLRDAACDVLICRPTSNH